MRKVCVTGRRSDFAVNFAGSGIKFCAGSAERTGNSKKKSRDARIPALWQLIGIRKNRFWKNEDKRVNQRRRHREKQKRTAQTGGPLHTEQVTCRRFEL